MRSGPRNRDGRHINYIIQLQSSQPSIDRRRMARNTSIVTVNGSADHDNMKSRRSRHKSSDKLHNQHMLCRTGHILKYILGIERLKQDGLILNEVTTAS